MPHGPLVYIITLLITGFLSALIAIIIYRRRSENHEAVLACLLLAISIYSTGYAFELASSTLPEMLFWSRVQYLGIAGIPALWFIMVTKYTGKDKRLTRPAYAALFLISALTFFLHLTDSYHRLFYHTLSVKTDPFPLLLFHKGPWYWLHVAFINLSVVSGNIMLLNMWWHASPPYKKQIMTIFVAALLPWIGHIIYLTGRSPFNLDLAPFAFACTALTVAWGLFRYNLFELIPVARDKVFDSMRDGVLVLDLKDRIIDFNPTAQSILKELSKNNIGKPAKEILRNYPGILKQLSSSDGGTDNLHISREGTFYYYNYRVSPIMDRNGKLIGKTIVLSDVTQQALLHDKLKTLATLDDLTSIFNRRHFIHLSKQELLFAKQYGQPTSIILMDLDNFKQINDTHGHNAGDTALKTVTEICKRNLRVSDFIGRYGGEEFVIFLPNTKSATALQVAERLRKSIANTPIKVGNNSVSLTASFGIVNIEKTGDTGLDELLKNADQALYQAKKAGRNCVSLVELP